MLQKIRHRVTPVSSEPLLQHDEDNEAGEVKEEDGRVVVASGAVSRDDVYDSVVEVLPHVLDVCQQKHMELGILVFAVVFIFAIRGRRIVSVDPGEETILAKG